MMSLFAFRPGREDPRDAVDYWDFGYEKALEEGEGLEELWLQQGDPTFRSERGYHIRNFDHVLLGKNEPEDWYLS
jgi:hypothetical protein